MKILLNRFKSKNSIDQDINLSLELLSEEKLMETNDINLIIDEYEQFSLERKSSLNYYLHAKLSIFRDLGYGYNDIVSSELSNLKNSLNIELVYPYEYNVLDEFKSNIIKKDGNKLSVPINFECKLNDVIIASNSIKKNMYKILSVEILSDKKIITLDRNIGDEIYVIPSIANYKRVYKKIEIDYDLFKCGLALNILGDSTWLFKSQPNLDLKDELNFPITELFYKFNFQGILPEIYINNQSDNSTNLLDIIEFDLNLINKRILYSAKSQFAVNNTYFNYDTFYRSIIRSYSNIIETGVTRFTGNLPDYSFNFGNGMSVWKDLLDIGFFQDGNGVDYPFLNNLHYVFDDIVVFFKRKTPLTLSDTNSPVDLIFNSDSLNVIAKYC